MRGRDRLRAGKPSVIGFADASPLMGHKLCGGNLSVTACGGDSSPFRGAKGGRGDATACGRGHLSVSLRLPAPLKGEPRAFASRMRTKHLVPS